MANIATTDITYAEVAGSAKASPSEPRKSAIFTVTFGNGVLTYPAGGVPLDKNKLGCPTQIDELTVIDAASANGFIYKYDLTNNKLRIFQGDNDNAGDAALIELIGAAAAPAAATLKVKVLGW